MAGIQRTKKGISLAKGPVGLVGLALLAYGITALIFAGHSFAQHAPSGAVHGKTCLGLEVNGWSGLLFTAAGVLLILGTPLHWGAKGIPLLVGIALVAACLIALANRHGAVGLFAANHLTELVWGAGGAVLIVLSLLPRVGGQTRQRPGRDPGERRPAGRRVETGPRIVERERPTEPTRVVERQGYPADGTLASAHSIAPQRRRPSKNARPPPDPIERTLANRQRLAPLLPQRPPPFTQTPLEGINHD